MLGILLWTPFSIIMSTWMSMANSRSINLEHSSLEIMATLSLGGLFAVVSLARTYNHHIYKLICTAMALDQSGQ